MPNIIFITNTADLGGYGISIGPDAAPTKQTGLPLPPPPKSQAMLNRGRPARGGLAASVRHGLAGGCLLARGTSLQEEEMRKQLQGTSQFLFSYSLIK